MARYIFSDLHGQLDLWEQIKSFLKEDDELYCLGDCVDRGPGGLQILKEVLADSRITMLRGNHEDFIIDLDDWMWDLNGGECTRDAIYELSDEEIEELREKLRALPELLKLDNKDGKHLILCHAGTDPWYSKEELEMRGRKDPYVWDRKHIHSVWSKDKEFEDVIVIHGHTPVTADHFLMTKMDPCLPGDEQFEPEYSPRVARYCDGHKIDIDMGCFFTGRTCLFDLDTFEAIYFEREDD